MLQSLSEIDKSYTVYILEEANTMIRTAQQNIQYTLSTQAIERVTPSKDALRLCEKLSDGKLSANAAVDAIKQKYGLTRGVSRA
jgi:hypothetical protein